MALQILVDHATITTDGPAYLAQGTIHYNDGVKDLDSFTLQSQMRVHKNNYDSKVHDDQLRADLKNVMKAHMAAYDAKLSADAVHTTDVENKLTSDGVNVGG